MRQRPDYGGAPGDPDPRLLGDGVRYDCCEGGIQPIEKNVRQEILKGYGCKCAQREPEPMDAHGVHFIAPPVEEGMSTQEFANTFERILHSSKDRICTVGHDQYAIDTGQGESQAFESRTLAEQFEEVREELYDAIVHTVALVIKLDRLEARVP